MPMNETLFFDGRAYKTTLKIANHVKALLVRVQLLKSTHRFSEADKVLDEIEEELANALFNLDAYEIDAKEVA